MRTGEKGVAYRLGPEQPWEPVWVLKGLGDPRVRPWGPLAVLRRKRDGQRVLLDSDGRFVEVPG